MNTQNAVVLTRSAERILVTLTGAFAIFLGYELFAMVATTVATSDSVFDVKNAAISIYVSHVGPGVFFALFGAGLIAYSVTRPLEFERRVWQSGNVTEEKFRGFEDRLGPAGGPSRGSIAREGVVKTLAEMTNELGAKSNPEPRKEVALREARVSLMCGSWKDEWGRPDDFKDWVYNFAEGDPPPPSINRAVAIYRGTA